MARLRTDPSAQTPKVTGSVYLDHAAATPPQRAVLEAMWPYLTRDFGNPSSTHQRGVSAREALQNARRRVAKLLGARSSEIIFTSGGTEADNAAIKGIVLQRLQASPPQQRAGRDPHVLISSVEHSAVLNSARWLERFGVEVELLPVDSQGLVDAHQLQAMLREETVLVSVQAANGEVGSCQDLTGLTEVLRGTGVFFHSDGVQAAGTQPITVQDLGVDALSLSGPKIGTPSGVGVLYLRRRTPYEPLIHGGGQQQDHRSGTENVAGAVGFATALELAAPSTDTLDTLRHRRDAFIAEVENTVQQAQLTGSRQHRLPGHASFVVTGHSGESLLLDLERAGIYCSSGSACSSDRQEPSHVLTAMGYSSDEALSALRFSFTSETTEQELAYTAHLLRELTAKSAPHLP